MTRPHFTIASLLAATNGMAQGLAPTAPINSISIDSRELGPAKNRFIRGCEETVRIL